MSEKCIIVAVADNMAIGRKNALLWNLPGDMKYFRETTTGYPVIMGWMTFQSIGRALPRRKNIVISEFPWPDAPDTVVVVPNLAEAFAAAEDAEKCFVIGGAYTYAQALETADTLYLTRVHDAPQDADVFFPEVSPEIFEEVYRSPLQTDPDSGITYEFTVLRRRPVIPSGSERIS